MKILVIIGMIVTLAVLSSIVTEQQDMVVLSYVHKAGVDVVKYQQQYNTLPNNLSEIGYKNVKCVYMRCFNLLYKQSSDKQDFKIVAKVNHPFMVYFSPDWRLKEYAYNCCYGIGLVEKYGGLRKDLPVYRKDTTIFAQPEKWPSI